MEENILNSIKEVVGINSCDKAFDTDIKLHINTSFSTLFQLGIGEKVPYRLDDVHSTWESMFSDYNDLLPFIKEYTFLKVKLLFDPPTHSSILDALKKEINEIEYRIIMQLETFKDDEDESK